MYKAPLIYIKITLLKQTNFCVKHVFPVLFVSWIGILKPVYAPLTVQDTSNAVQMLWE